MPHQALSPRGRVTDLRLASKSVDWFSVHAFVVPLLDEVGSWPVAGSPSWAALDDTDPRKIAALYDAARQHALRIDTLQEEMAATSREISQMENWNTQRRRMFNHAQRIPRRKAIVTEEEFWSATDHLRLIYQWARASYVAPWALLIAVLPRVIATTGPHVMLPGPPAPASLNMGVVLVGRSGAGKGVTDKLSRVVWPADIHEEGLGSGQGIAELFKEQKNPDDRITRALISVSEIDHLTALHAGTGNSTRAAIKAALTGDRLGSKGASAVTTRAVPADSYRLCLSISAQFGHCGVLLDDVSGGTPQRQLWMLVTDPDMPEELGPTPDRVLDVALPPWAGTGNQVLIQYGPSEIREYINAGLWASGRGTSEAIDGHRTLTRLKVAAALAILDHRMVVSAVDWDLSEIIMAKSDATRDSVLEYDRQAAKAKVRERAVARAVGDSIYDDRILEMVKRSILRMLERDGEQVGGDLRRRLGKREKRELFDQAVRLLELEGLVSARTGEHNSTRYRIGSPVTNQVTPQNASSEGVTTEVTRDHSEDASAPQIPSSRDSTATGSTQENVLTTAPNATRRNTCERCYVALPTAAKASLCDDCDGAPANLSRTANEHRQPLQVVHSGRISKHEGGLVKPNYSYTAPNGMPPRQMSTGTEPAPLWRTTATEETA